MSTVVVLACGAATAVALMSLVLLGKKKPLGELVFPLLYGAAACSGRPKLTPAQVHGVHFKARLVCAQGNAQEVAAAGLYSAQCERHRCRRRARAGPSCNGKERHCSGGGSDVGRQLRLPHHRRCAALRIGGGSMRPYCGAESCRRAGSAHRGHSDHALPLGSRWWQPRPRGGGEGTRRPPRGGGQPGDPAGEPSQLREQGRPGRRAVPDRSPLHLCNVHARPHAHRRDVPAPPLPRRAHTCPGAPGAGVRRFLVVSLHW